MDNTTIEKIIYKYGCIWHNGNNYLKMSDVVLIAKEWASLQTPSPSDRERAFDKINIKPENKMIVDLEIELIKKDKEIERLKGLMIRCTGECLKTKW